jgi:hypothetical protein
VRDPCRPKNDQRSRAKLAKKVLGNRQRQETGSQWGRQLEEHSFQCPHGEKEREEPKSHQPLRYQHHKNQHHLYQGDQDGHPLGAMKACVYDIHHESACVCVMMNEGDV